MLAFLSAEEKQIQTENAWRNMKSDARKTQIEDPVHHANIGCRTGIRTTTGMLQAVRYRSRFGIAV
jgi:hypothetical protein